MLFSDPEKHPEKGVSFSHSLKSRYAVNADLGTLHQPVIHCFTSTR